MDYVVKDGDCLSTIAAAHGFRDWKVIYDAPENDGFRKKRPNPNVIYAGDKVFIPEKDLKEESCATDQKHTFKAKVTRWVFRLELRDEEFELLEDRPFKLFVDGELVKEGTSGSKGLIEVPLPAGARCGRLEFLGESIELRFGELDPIARATGVQQRLNNLGFDCGVVDGIVGRRTRRALARFQGTHGLEATGQIDDATRAKLLEVHDNDTRVADAEEDMESSDSEDGEPPEQSQTPEAGFDADDDIVELHELDEGSIKP